MPESSSVWKDSDIPSDAATLHFVPELARHTAYASAAMICLATLRIRGRTDDNRGEASRDADASTSMANGSASGSLSGSVAALVLDDGIEFRPVGGLAPRVGIL